MIEGTGQEKRGDLEQEGRKEGDGEGVEGNESDRNWNIKVWRKRRSGSA